MPTLKIGDKSVKVDDSFSSLSPEDKQRVVEHIAGQIGAAPSAPDAPVSVNNVVRSTGEGVPIFGGLLNKANAATNAALAPLVEPYLSPSSSDLTRDNGAPVETSFGQRYDKSLAMQNKQSEDFGKAHPVIDTAAKIVGGTAALAPVAAIAPVAMGLEGTTAQMLAKGALSGGAIGGTDAAVRGENPVQGALFGAAGGAAAGPAGKVIGKALTPKAETALPVKDLEEAASKVYNSPEIKALNLNPDVVRDVSTKAQQELLMDGHRPVSGSAPRTFNILQDIVPGDGVSAVKVDDLRAARRALQEVAGETHEFKPTPDARAATKSIGWIDEILDRAAPQLREANANWAAAQAARQVDTKLIKADHRAARTGSGTNIENTMRQEADKIGNRGLTQAERDLRDQIVEGTFSRNALRKVGKLGFSDGLSLLLHGGAAIGTGGASIPFGFGGLVARKVGERMTRKQMEQLSEMMRSRAPASKAMVASKPAPAPVRPVVSPMLLSQSVDRLPFSLAPVRADEKRKPR